MDYEGSDAYSRVHCPANTRVLSDERLKEGIQRGVDVISLQCHDLSSSRFEARNWLWLSAREYKQQVAEGLLARHVQFHECFDANASGLVRSRDGL